MFLFTKILALNIFKKTGEVAVNIVVMSVPTVFNFNSLIKYWPLHRYTIRDSEQVCRTFAICAKITKKSNLSHFLRFQFVPHTAESTHR